MKLDKTAAGKIVKIDTSRVVEVPADVFSTGDIVVMFNNTDEFVCVDSKVPNSYVSGRIKKRTKIEFPPRALGNVLFIDEQTAVFSGDMN